MSVSSCCGTKSFFILSPGGNWQCERSYGKDASAGTTSSPKSGSRQGAGLRSKSKPASSQVAGRSSSENQFSRLAGLASVMISTLSSTSSSSASSKSEPRGQSKKSEGDSSASDSNTAEGSNILSLRTSKESVLIMLQLDHHTLVLEVDPRLVAGTALPAQRLQQLANLLTLLFGPSSLWYERAPSGSSEVSRLDTNGIEDIVDSILTSMDPTLVLGGVRRVRLPESTHKQLESLFKSASFPVSSGDTGDAGSVPQNGSTQRGQRGAPNVALLTHGFGSVLHSNIQPLHLRRIVMLLQLRSLKPFKSTTTPIFLDVDTSHARSGSGVSSGNKTRDEAEGAWFQMVVLEVQKGVLVGQFPINTEPSDALEYLSNLQQSLYESCDAILPSEAPPVPLHQYVSQEVIAFAVYNRNNKISLVPKMRPSPAAERTKLWNLFWWFLAGALEAWRAQPTLKRVVLVQGEIAFHSLRTSATAVKDGPGVQSVDVFLMVSSSATSEQVHALMSNLARKCTATGTGSAP